MCWNWPRNWKPVVSPNAKLETEFSSSLVVSPYLQLDLFLPDLHNFQLEINDNRGEILRAEGLVADEGLDQTCLPYSGVADAQDLEEIVVADDPSPPGRATDGAVAGSQECGCGAFTRGSGMGLATCILDILSFGTLEFIVSLLYCFKTLTWRKCFFLLLPRPQRTIPSSEENLRHPHTFWSSRHLPIFDFDLMTGLSRGRPQFQERPLLGRRRRKSVWQTLYSSFRKSTPSSKK